MSEQLASSWDLPTVLDALSGPPSEPLEEVDLETALLLSLASAKRVGKIHALSVHQACTKFSLGKVTLQPNPAFVSKVLGSCSLIDLVSFYQIQIQMSISGCLCPVRVLRIYIDPTKSCRKSDQLFVSWQRTAWGSQSQSIDCLTGLWGLLL